VLAAGDGELELGADTVGGGDEQGIAIAGRLEIEESAEPAEAGGAAGPGRGAGKRLDRLDQGIAGIDVDAGRFIGPGVRPAVYGILPGDAL
jgi:hypothetical protein